MVFRSIDIAHQLVPYPCLRFPVKAIEKVLYSKADMILSLTPGLTGYVTKLGAQENKVKLLSMPVDTKLFYPFTPAIEEGSRWGIGTNDKVILYMGTLFDFSGLDAIIRQFPGVINKVPGARLLIVGDGPQRPRLESIITEMGLSQKVTITGFQLYETMPQYINLATLCINPFLIMGATRDIFPGKIVQYLACAKPVVATPLPGLVALTPGEEQGLLYAETPAIMIEKILALLESSEYREKLGRNGLEYTRQRHSYESIAQQLEARLQEAIVKK